MVKKKKKKIKQKRKRSNTKKATSHYFVEYPTSNGETRRLIRVADWNRIKRKIENFLKEGFLEKIMLEVAIFFLGVSATSFFSLISLDRKTSNNRFFIYVCVGISSLILAVILFFVHWQKNKDKKDNKEEIKTDMEEIENTFGKEI